MMLIHNMIKSILKHYMLLTNPQKNRGNEREI